MEYRTLKNEIELLESVQRLMNEVNTELDFNANYMTLLELFSTMKRLKIIQPKWIFKVARTPPLEENIFFRGKKKNCVLMPRMCSRTFCMMCNSCTVLCLHRNAMP